MTIYIEQDTLKEINLHGISAKHPYKGRSRVTPTTAAEVGLVEIPEPLPPADAQENPDQYTVDTTKDGMPPYRIWTRKSDDQIAWAHNDKVWMQINAKEQQQLMPRVLREFLLEQPGADQKPWFAKIKAADDEIVALKAQLVPENPRPVMP